MSRRRSLVVTIVAIAVALAACGSSGTVKSSTPTTQPAASNYPVSTASAPGITATSIKLGIGLVDFNCVRQFTDTIRENQDKIYSVFVNDINKKGGIDGRQIKPVFHLFCPVNGNAAQQLCTQFTEDDHVFAVMGNLYDPTGAAQTCVAKAHNTPLLTFELSDAIIAKSPGGMVIFAGNSPERVAGVLLELVKQQKLLAGKTVGVLAESGSTNTVKESIEPGIKAMADQGVKLGSTAIISVGTNTDTTAAQAQLDSAIERWKTEGVNAIVISGEAISSQQFVTKIKQQLPGVQLLADNTQVKSYGQQEKQAGVTPNPYEGIITAGGPTSKEYDDGPNWAYCSQIWKEQTGQTPPNAETVLKTSDGKILDTYGGINDACQLLSLFHDIMVKVGKYPNAANWRYTVDRMGAVTNRGGGPYASLTAGKYDIDDSFRLEAFDSSIAQGDFKPLTPIQNITGVSASGSG